MSVEPRTRDEIERWLAKVEEEVAGFFGALTPDEFVHRVDQAWTPAEHLRHLNTSVAAVAQGLRVPRLLLRLRFGRARQPSRGYETMRDDYRDALRLGGAASGRYVPRRENLAPADVTGRRGSLLGRWEAVNAGLRAGLRRWRETDLDRLRMPHPLLGLLTVREMLFFTAYHNLHHVEAAGRRLPRFAEPRTAAD
jgi:hypothetical protein